MPIPTRFHGAPLFLILAGLSSTRADEPPGARIYREQCASCHGADGQGVMDEYAQPLVGDRSVGSLTRLIDRTMPSDDPDACKGEDAEAVASFIYDAFYSPTAQARNRPPRIELQRLTVRQYRNVAADLVGAFRGVPFRGDGEPGLKAQYYKGRRFRPDSLAFERVDGRVRFDFGIDSPDAENIPEAHEFSIRWEGTVLAPETGHYEFIVRTEHSNRLWVNDLCDPLIDATVKSGNEAEFRESIYLVGGRAYPIRLEFSKAKQGVDDSKDRKGPPPDVHASIELAWRPPKRAEGPIPSRFLTTSRAPEQFVLTAAFPPDDRSEGYERGSSVSEAWVQATTEAALEVAAYVSARADELAGVRVARRGGVRRHPDGSRVEEEAQDGEPAAARVAKLKALAARFAERAFHRPLTVEERALYVDRQFEAAPDPEAAVKRSVLLTLKSPSFLYREVAGRGDDPYEVAERLAFGLWDSLPDDELLHEAREGRLATREQVAARAERMLADPRARAKIDEFLLTWLGVAHHPDLAKDKERFPEFDEATIDDLRASLELTLAAIAWGDEPDFRRLLLDGRFHLNGRLARLYGVDLPEDADFRPVELDPGERSGVIAHPYLLAAYAYTDATSPIHRGVFLARGVLGRRLRPPPEAFAPLAPDLHPDLTTRERVTLQTSPESCMSCHSLINPLGFALEGFDAVGRLRPAERDRPVDAAGSYETVAGEHVEFAGSRGLAEFLAASPEVHRAFAEQLFRHLVKQPAQAFGPDVLDRLSEGFASGDFSIRKLAALCMAESALRGRADSPVASAAPAAGGYAGD